MDPKSIDETLSEAEAALAQGRGLGGTGFWSAVKSIKSDPGLVERYADRVAIVDQKAFLSWALLTVPVAPGTALMVVATLAGLAATVAAAAAEDWVAIGLFYLGLVILLVTTHGLAHLAIGRWVGIRFTHWFIGTLMRPQPGVKTDYASYLRTEARSRAWMHASGAIVTKAVPLWMIAPALALDLPGWVVVSLLAITLVSSITDWLWSTKASDWKKFRREMEFAQPS